MNFKSMLAFVALVAALTFTLFSTPGKAQAFEPSAGMYMLDFDRMAVIDPLVVAVYVAVAYTEYMQLETSDDFSLALLVVDFDAIAQTELVESFGYDSELHSHRIVTSRAESYGLRSRSVAEVFGFSPIMLC